MKTRTTHSAIFVIALICLSIMHLRVFAQNARQESQQPQYNAARELQNFRADSPVPELNELRLELLQAKAKLEAVQKDRINNASDIALLRDRVASIQMRIDKYLPYEKKLLQSASTIEQNRESETSNHTLTPSQVALKNFQADSPNKELNDLQYLRLQLKVEMELEQRQTTMSQEKMAVYQDKISRIELKIREISKQENQ